MQKTPRIVMTYSCNQNWDAMTPAKDGRHCKACMTTVIDFTKMTVLEIKKYSENKGSLCGSFSIKQLEPELIEVSSFFTPLKKYIIVLFTLLTSELASGNTLQNSKNEIKYIETTIQNNSNPFRDKYNSIGYINSNGLVKSHEQEDNRYITKTTKKRRRLYISKRFPFIHYRKRVILTGRYRHDE